MEMNSRFLEEINSSDQEIRRKVIEEFSFKEIPDELIETFVNCLVDEDSGVRDAASIALINSQNPDIPNSIVKLIKSNDLSIRNLVGEILIKKGRESMPALFNFLPEGNDDDKKFIIDIIGLIGDSSDEKKIISFLHNTSSQNLILSCIETLGNIKSKASVKELINFYFKDNLYKPTIIESLGKIGSAEALDFIMNNYLKEDELTKYSMIEALGEIGDEDTFFFLLSEMKNLEPPLSWIAIQSIYKLKEKLSLDVPFDEAIENVLLNTLVEGELKFKKAASALLLNFEEKKIIETFLQVYGFDSEIDGNLLSHFLKFPIETLQIIPEQLKKYNKNQRAILELIILILENVSVEKLNQLSEIDLHNLCESISDFFEHPNEEVRRIAMELIFTLDSEMAFTFIDIFKSDSNIWNKLRLIEILENFSTKEAQQALLSLSKDKEGMVREKAEMIISSKDTNPLVNE